MKEKTKITVLAVVATVFGIAVIAVLFMLFAQRDAAKAANDTAAAYRDNINSYFDRSLYDAEGCVNDMALSLSKLQAASTPARQSLILSDVWRSAGQAQSLLCQLPIEGQNLSQTLAYINQTGDYCYMLSLKVNGGQALTDEDKKQLVGLAESCSDMVARMQEERESDYAWNIGGETPEGQESGSYGVKLAESIQNYPKLIYDGPFSDTAANREPATKLGAEVSSDQALKELVKMFGGSYEKTADEDGRVRCFVFEGKTEGGIEVTARITKEGGYVMSVMASGFSDKRDIKPSAEENEALENEVKDFLTDVGYEDFSATYTQYYNGCAIFNMAPDIQGVLIYPDLVKVWIDIETRQITGIDATNYLMAHKEREFDEPTFSLDEAEARTAQLIQIEGSRLTLVPADDLTEKLCYEFTGKSGDMTLVVHVDVLSGQEVDILQIVDAENGTFVY